MLLEDKKQTGFRFKKGDKIKPTVGHYALMVKPIIVMEPELKLFSSKYFIGAGARDF
jgi:hypothetical protein